MNTNIKSFFDLGLKKYICNKLDKLGYKNPFPIQIKSIPYIINGFDIIGIANTGSGKTMSFVLPFIDKIDININKSQFLIIEPTRELVIQTNKVILNIINNIKNINTSSLYGGQNYNIQFKTLRYAHIIIGTPGRLIDHINRKTLNLSNIKFLVIDEADEMLDMGFIDSIKKIISNININHQTLLFSATFTHKIKKIAYNITNNPKEIYVYNNNKNINIEQFYFKVNNFNKIDILFFIIKTIEFNLCLIFVNTKNLSLELFNLFNKFNYKVSYINGNLNQNIREKTINLFKLNKINILIATDIAARGIDINNIDLVINYDSPNNINTYIHRIGRTGRAGSKGKSFILINKPDFYFLNKIKLKFNFIKKFSLLDASTLENIKFDFIKDEINILLKNKINNYKKYIYKLLDITNNDNIELINLLLNIIENKKYKF